MNAKLLFAIVISALAIAGAAMAYPADGEGPRRMGKVVFGTLDSIDIAGNSAIIVVEKYMVRGEGEVAGNGEKLKVVFHDKSKFGLRGEKASLSDFKKGDSVVAVVVEKDGSEFAISLSDPETAKKFKEKMRGKMQGKMHGKGAGDGMSDGCCMGMGRGEGMRDGRGPGMGHGEGMHDGRGPGMGRDGKFREGRPMMKHGMPVYGEILSMDKDFITVKVEPLPFEQLGFDGPKERPGFFGKDGERKLPDTIKIKIDDKSIVMLGGEKASINVVKKGMKFVFRCVAPEGDWNKDNRPEYLIAMHIVDLETVKKHMAERQRPADGRRGPQ